MTDTERTRLIQDHCDLVDDIVRSFVGKLPRFLDRSELQAAGMLGLVEAAHRFDPGYSVPFARFASRRIRGAILDLLRGSDWAPRSVRSLVRQVEQAEQILAAELGSRPDDAAVADAIGVEEVDLRSLRANVTKGALVSLERLTDGTGSAARADQLVDRTAGSTGEALELEELRGYVRDALRLLPERHRVVAIGCYLEDRSFAELAELLAVSPSRISQIRSEAIEMMRDAIETQFSGKRDERPFGRVAKRKATMAAKVAASSSWRDRLLARDQSLRAELAHGSSTVATAASPTGT